MAYGERETDEAVVVPIDDGAPRPDAADEDAGGRDDEPHSDATRPVGGTVPQAARPRPAEPSAVAAPSGRRPASFPGSYSFDPVPPVTWGRRLRSALGVLLVVVAVGLGLAASLGVLAAFVSRALEGAVN